MVNSKNKKPSFNKTIPNGWEIKEFGQVAEIVMGQSPAGNTYNRDGIGIALINGPTEFTEKYPVKVQWTKSPTKICKTGDILICVRGSSTGRLNIANEEYCIGRGVAAIRSKMNSEHSFLEFLIESIIDKILILTTGSTFPNIDSSSLRKIKIYLPPLSEQHAIANCLGIWDDAINKTQQLLSVKEHQKKGLMQLLFTGKRRLKGFKGEWKETYLSDLFTERNETKYFDLPLLSVGASGIYPQSDSVKKDTSNEDKSKYKRICPGDIGYNTMRMWQGRSALSGIEGIISPAYTVVTPNRNTNSLYFSYLFKTSKLTNLFWRKSQGLVDDTLNCKFKDFSLVKISVPQNIKEQTAIAELLLVSDKEIQLLKTKLNNLKEQKKGIMQLLLTGKKRLKIK
jgi:type I restriction enzyme S subunit